MHSIENLILHLFTVHEFSNWALFVPQLSCQFPLFTNTSVQLKVLFLIPSFQLVIIILIRDLRNKRPTHQLF